MGPLLQWLMTLRRRGMKGLIPPPSPSSDLHIKTLTQFLGLLSAQFLGFFVDNVGFFSQQDRAIVLWFFLSIGDEGREKLLEFVMKMVEDKGAGVMFLNFGEMKNMKP